MSSPSDLTGKIALVTGASRGIGRATALALAAAGATVVVNYLSSSAQADEVVKQIGGADRAIALQGDVSDVESSRKLIQETVSRYGRIDILALNAGLLFQHGGLSDAVTSDDFDRLFTANVKGPFFMVREAAPHIPSNAGGRVFLFSTSLTALSGILPNYLLYVATKGAVEQMSRVMAKDLGKRGICVNTISPGPVGTEAYFVGKTDQLVTMQKGMHPMNRLAEPEEVANVIVALSGKAGDWVNGQNVRINGGMTVG